MKTQSANKCIMAAIQCGLFVFAFGMVSCKLGNALGYYTG